MPATRPHSSPRDSFLAPLLTSAALGALCVTTPAQVPPVYLVGQATASGVAQNVVLSPCSSPVTLCATGIAAPSGYEGGTAYDPINQLVWNTNGSRLQATLATMGFECDMSCDAPSPVPNVTGLAFDSRDGRLWLLGALPEIVKANARSGDCPQVESRCSLSALLPAGAIAAGLALSEKRGLLFYSASTLGSTPRNVVIVAPTSDPCRALCTFDLGTPFGVPQTEPITGLGYDDCDDELFAVAGSVGMLRARLAFAGCTVASSSFCVASSGYRFHGLCLHPPAATIVGRTCTAPPCPSCTPRFRVNDATLGNSGFVLSVYYAPRSGIAVPFVSLGGCGAGVPVLCGRFFPALSPEPLVLPTLSLVGPSTCTGAAALPIPIPADGAVCGVQLCMQVVIGCQAGGLGLSDALQFRIVGA